MTGEELPARGVDPLASYTAIGWTIEEWGELYEAMAAGNGEPGTFDAQMVARWICQPRQFRIPITTAHIRDLYHRNPKCAAMYLTALSKGAPETFLDALLTVNDGSENEYTLDSAWASARSYDLTGPQASGWAAVGGFHVASAAEVPIAWWVNQLGPDAYLYVMAGFTVKEAGAMQEAGTTPSNQQLKVMAALNGYNPPA